MKTDVEKALSKIFRQISKHVKDDLYFLSERDVQAFLYCGLRKTLGSKYRINADPTMSKKGKYPTKVKKFELPDIMVNDKSNIQYLESKPGNRIKRIKLKNLNQCYAIEIKFVRVNNKQQSRVSNSDLRRDIAKMHNKYRNWKLVIVDMGKSKHKVYEELKNKYGNKVHIIRRYSIA